jgi:SAM-dependent methyltransferase
MHGDLDAWLAALAGSDEDFVERAWRLTMRRAPEPDGRERALAKLRDGTLSRTGLLRELVGSDEFERVAALDDGIARAAAARAAECDHRGPPRPRELHAPPASDERAIEIPWCLARYDGERRVLDVGYAFAEPAYLAGLATLGAPELVGVDLAFCVSTLEHVGRDNEVYDVDAPREESGDEAGLRELRRVLTGDGRLLVTVPTGTHDDQGWQVVRTPDEWIELFERAGFLVYEDELYVRAPEGWRTASLDEARAAPYREDGAGAVLLAELRPGSFGGKVRLAVRDVRHAGEIRRSTVVS